MKTQESNHNTGLCKSVETFSEQSRLRLKITVQLLKGSREAKHVSDIRLSNQ